MLRIGCGAGGDGYQYGKKQHAQLTGACITQELAQGEADIAAGRLIPQEEVFAKLRERFAPDA